MFLKEFFKKLILKKSAHDNNNKSMKKYPACQELMSFRCNDNSCRANPGSEFVVANTLAKWKKLESNEINFSQSLSQKVLSTSCFVFNFLPARGDICCLLITFANSFDPNQARQMMPDLDPNCLTP